MGTKGLSALPLDMVTLSIEEERKTEEEVQEEGNS